MFNKLNWCVTVLCCVLVMPSLASAYGEENQSWSATIGAGVGVSMSEYKKTDARVLPLPIIRYDDGRFFWYGLTGGMHVYRDGINTVSLNLSYMDQEFKASRSSSHAMKQLDNRRSSLGAGAAYALTTNMGTLRLAATVDVLDNSNGLVIDTSYRYPLYADRTTITPYVGVMWTSENYNDYYYGVSKSESRKSGLRSYKADSGFSPYIGVNINVNLVDQWNLYVNAAGSLLSNEMRDSPMVDKSVKLTMGTGISYSF